MHKFLGHSAAIIEANKGEGLKKFSEEGFEACNKKLKQIRCSLSRKDSQINNLTDCIKRMWLNSDPLVVHERIKARKSCESCGEVGHTSRSSLCPLKETNNDNPLFEN